ncbi:MULTISPECIES: flavodoxin family protein [Halobacillus]|uniref:flavodoxin family protein n=1 Tax=Halobacillus TaxID=45667 RepID=UPI001370D25D|nr:MULTISPECIES: flavodoxin family protein [Halobacillus]MYL30135.1 flavodoxin family protein [Halobacillus halophilus]MYL37399.1 flavodoxin family protein [Halobacillus litoralis]
MKIAVLNGGSRQGGNTQMLTEKLVEGLEVTTFHLETYTILPIMDGRHDEGGFLPVDDDYKALMEQVMSYDLLIFATPVYWYSMSAAMKLFIDRWSQTMRDSEYGDFRERMAEKQAVVLAVGGDSPYMKALPLLQQFQHIFQFVHLPFSGYVLGQANKPGEILEDSQALFAAEEWNKKLHTLIKA